MERNATSFTAPELPVKQSLDTPAPVVRLFAGLGESAGLVEAFRVSPSFLCVLRGPDHVIEMANDAYQRLVGDRDTIGLRVRDALPEVVEQGFITLLDTVFQTGEPFVGREVPVSLARTAGSPPEELYVDFIYQALTGPNGERTGILVHGYDITGHVLARREVERLLAESRSVQEALEDANTQLEEQQAELETTNQQLQENAVELEAQAEELEVTTQDLAERTELPSNCCR